MRSAFYGLRHPASASCLGRHSRLAGRCPNNSSLFPPLAAVVIVAAHGQRKEYLYFRSTGASADTPVLHFHGRGWWVEKFSPFCTNALKNCRIRMEKTSLSRFTALPR